eukprot:9468076-Pyramimonas_sp.AAC.1
MARARGEVKPGGGGGSFRRGHKSYQAALGILARLDVPGGTVADSFALRQSLPARLARGRRRLGP